MKKSVKKKAAKKAAKKATKKAAKKKAKKRPYREPGFSRRSGSGLFMPDSVDDVSAIVAPSKLGRGIAEAKLRMKDLIYEIGSTMGDDFDVSEVEFEASFSADGKFMGFGVGGATSIKIRIREVE